MWGENEKPISFGDKSIKFIRLTLANANDHFKLKVPVTSTSAEQQRAPKPEYGVILVQRSSPLWRAAERCLATKRDRADGVR